MSNLAFTFVIEPDGADKFEVVAKSRDIAHWERTFKGASINKLQTDPAVNDLEQLAWVTATRRNKFSGNLNEFQQSCDFDMLDPDEDEGDADNEAGPTHAAR